MKLFTKNVCGKLNLKKNYLDSMDCVYLTKLKRKHYRFFDSIFSHFLNSLIEFIKIVDFHKQIQKPILNIRFEFYDIVFIN